LGKTAREEVEKKVNRQIEEEGEGGKRRRNQNRLLTFLDGVNELVQELLVLGDGSSNLSKTEVEGVSEESRVIGSHVETRKTEGRREVSSGETG